MAHPPESAPQRFIDHPLIMTSAWHPGRPPPYLRCMPFLIRVVLPSVSMLAVALLPLFLLFAPARAQEAPVTFAVIEQMAAKLAAAPYKEPPSIGGEMKQLSYDHYRAIRARKDTALWRDKGLFQVEFFPAGFIYEKPVAVSVVENGRADQLTVTPDQFDFSDSGLKQPPKEVALAGFKLTFPINQPHKFDEIIAFLGASYFRAIGRGQVYGSSARGLAIDTGTERPEEFPWFRAFWLVKPPEHSQEMTVWALLDSPGAAGALSFIVRPGPRTVVETMAVFFARHELAVPGIAPLTSMYFAGKASPPRDDYRPEIHDADGLYISTGQGQRIWRPLSNPANLAVAAFSDNNPRGFGLLQRERAFDQYQDTAANLQARPSLWVEPMGDWGDGEVRLIELPSKAETNDNIVAFWKPRWPIKQNSRFEAKYRLSALIDDTALSPAGRVVATRAGSVPSAPKQRRLVVEFAGGELATLAPEQPLTAGVALSSGKVVRTYVEPLPMQDKTKGAWRMFIDYEPDPAKPGDLSATLQLRGVPLTETFVTTVRP
jgi:periplasmic glucans biosynthesis protein